MNPQDLRTKVRNKVLDLRGIDRAVSKGSFLTAHRIANDSQRLALEAAIFGVEFDKMKKILDDILETDDLTMKDLRELAKEMQIPKYSSMTKDTLVSIVKARNGKS